MAAEQATLAVVAAAGGSTRMGCPKALLDWEGEPLVSAHVASLTRSCEVIVVTGHAADAVRAAAGCPTLHNPEWATTGMIESVRRVARAFPHRTLLVQPVDTPPVEAAVLDALLGTGRTCVPLDADGRRGHPVFLDHDSVRGLFDHPHLRALTEGALLVQTQSRLCSLGFNDPEELERARGVARGGLEPPTPRV